MAAAPTLNKRVLWSAEEEDIIKREVLQLKSFI
jgi:hypothetical protein